MWPRAWGTPGIFATLLAVAFLLLSASSPGSKLDKLDSIEIRIAAQPFQLWVADSPPERQRGLMFVTAEEMSPLEDGTARGMLFVFSREQPLSFWMKNTIIPLDIAYLDNNGIVTSTYTMTPLDERRDVYVSGRPARFAIEVQAGVWKRLGIAPGDRIELPTKLLHP